MKKNLILSVLMLSVLVMVVGCVSAVSYDSQLILENKDSGWQPITVDGIQAILQYNSIGQEFEYHLEAQGLDNVEYALIYYADDEERFTVWGGSPAVLIDSGTAISNELVLDGSTNIGDLPFEYDWNVDGEPNYCNFANGFDNYIHCYGAKIWLVPMSDYDTGINKVINWNPTEWLFETDLITYVEDDDGPVITNVYTEPAYPNLGSTLVKVYATITDEVSGVDYANLLYRIGGDPTIYEDTFTGPFSNGEAGIYYANPLDGVRIDYHIKAVDNSGNIEWLPSSSTWYDFTYDGSDPTTTLTIGDPKYGEPPYISSDTILTLHCTDSISECYKTYFKEESEEEWNEYTEPISAPIGAPDDSYTIYYYSVDNAGNVETPEKSQEVTLDNTEPEVVLNELDEFYNSVPINLEFTYSDDGSGVSEYKVYKKRLGVDNEFVEVTSISCVEEITTICKFIDGSKDGQFEFYVEVIDNVGNSQDSNVVSTTLDRTGPDAVNLENPSDGLYINSQPLLSWFVTTDNNDNLNPPEGLYGVSGIKEYELEIDGISTTMDELEYQTSSLSEDSHTWKVRAWDNADNDGVWSETRTFTIDTTAPEISDVDVTPKYVGSIYVAGTITASATVTDLNGVGSVKFALASEDCTDNNGADGWTCDIDTTLIEDGEYSLVVTAVDIAQNENVDTSLNGVVDNTGPVTIIISPEESSLFASDFEVSVEDSDNGSGLDYCEYRVNGGSWIPRICNSEITITVGDEMNCDVEGEDVCKVEVKATDNSENGNIVVERTFSIDWTNPPQILGSGPSGTIINDWAVLHIETNKPATCRYDTEYKSSYGAMSEEMENTGGLEHTHTLTDLTDKQYSYYVLCEANVENEMTQPVSILFDVDTRETFVVTIPETKGNYLIKGWNQFFLPSFVLDDTTLTGPYEIDEVLASIEGKWDALYHFDGTELKKSYRPQRPVNDLTEFNGGGFPYFIYMNVSGERIEIL